MADAKLEKAVIKLHAHKESYTLIKTLVPITHITFTTLWLDLNRNKNVYKAVLVHY